MSSYSPNAGSGLEFRTAAYFQAHGYLVRRGVMLSVAAGTAEATDIDLLAIRFSVPLAEERLIADCKDRRKPRPFERILWTRGLASFSQATHPVVVMPTVPWQAREFATQGGVEILAAPDVDAFLRTQEQAYRPFGEANPALAAEVEARRKRAQSHDRDKQFAREDLKLRQMLIFGHPLTNLNRVIRSLSSAAKFTMRDAGDSGWLGRYDCFNAAVVASVMLLRFAAEVKWTPEAEWTDYARKKLTYGDVPPQKARQLAKLALDQEFYDGFPSPQYTDEILDVLRLLISQPHAAVLAPYAVDYSLLGRGLGGSPNNHVLRAMGERQEVAFKVARRVLSALAYAAEMPANIWEVDKARDGATPTDQNMQPPLPAVGPGRETGGDPTP